MRQGFADMEKSLFDNDLETTTSVQNPATSTSTHIRHGEAAAYSRQDTFSLDIETNDGDIVTLHFDNTQAAGFQQRMSQNSHETRLQYQDYRMNASNLAIRVEGELDDKELDAIHSLVNDIGVIAGDFFTGDMEATFGKSLELGFDTSELRAVSLDLATKETFKYAAVYQQSAPQVQREQSPMQKLLDYTQSLQDQVHQAQDKLDKLDPVRFTEKLFNELIHQQQEFIEKSTQDQEKLNNIVANLFELATPQDDGLEHAA